MPAANSSAQLAGASAAPLTSPASRRYGPAMRNALTSSILGLALVLSASACGKKADPAKAKIECKPGSKAFNCSVEVQGGEGSKEVCWDINVACANGKKGSANTCQTVSANGKASSLVPEDKFALGGCDKATGVSVENIKFKK